ncbi:MAG TPA: response regulator [Desulfotomaculum sp.]|nr:MAG: Response regulator receiver and ANTAR domain protein [Desulfotomaculum sp. 46_80]HAG11876.1 response regulator [Desulfotomaculum sp.]HBY03005.1 response regulator [Desulfotomaculum sp.]
MAESRIVIVDADPALRKSIKTMLIKLGYSIVGEAGDGVSAIKLVRSRQPDLLVIGAELTGMDGLEVATIVHEDKIAPVIVLAGSHSQVLLEKAKAARVSAFLVKPVEEADLLPAVEISISNYQEIISLENKIKKMEEVLTARKLVEQAKGILMETMNISEAEAFKRIQKQSMNSRVTMRQVAEAIILTQNLRK